VLAALAGSPGAVPVLPVTDTVRRIAEGRSAVVPRKGLFRTQTPQGFHWAALWEAHCRARERGLRATDDAQLLEEAGLRLAFVEGDPENVKLTTRDDWRWAEWRLGRA
jgi:2-C-methyl-D-erythritol 4-phosphate cytidylyltransferase/2-C-methyl-D-erythritol 2,4-cyclodiphosphate synthase